MKPNAIAATPGETQVCFVVSWCIISWSCFGSKQSRTTHVIKQRPFWQFETWSLFGQPKYLFVQQFLLWEQSGARDEPPRTITWLIVNITQHAQPIKKATRSCAATYLESHGPSLCHHVGVSTLVTLAITRYQWHRLGDPTKGDPPHYLSDYMQVVGAMQQPWPLGDNIGRGFPRCQVRDANCW